MRKIIDHFRRSAKVEHIMEDELFGNLTWGENYYGWRGIMTMANGKPATFTVGGVETEESITEAARDTFKFLIANEGNNIVDAPCFS